MGDQNFRMMCFHGDIEGVRTALDNGADVNEATFNGGCTALMWALHRHHNDVVQVLLNHPEIDVNIIMHSLIISREVLI